MKKEIITITGALGSGKSVVGKAVAGLLGAPYFSTGDVQRALAERKGMTTLELNRLAETNPEIDYEIDGLMREFGEKNARCVIDSRLAWHFVPLSFKCYLHVHEKVGIERILGDTRRKSEKYGSIEEAYRAVVGRKASEDKRFAALYDLNLGHMGNYDLVVDTSVARSEAIAEMVLACFRAWLDGAEFGKYWASPKALFPTRGDVQDAGPVRVVDKDGFHLVVSGEGVVSAAIRRGDELVAYERVEENAEAAEAVVREWERTHGFEFFAWPEFEV